MGLISRTPCNPIAPTTVNAAASSPTESGIPAQRLRGTDTNSACGPLETTRSPAFNVLELLLGSLVERSPLSITRPTLQYPSGIAWSSFVWTASIVAIRPSVRNFSRTTFTLSGCWRAFLIKPALPNSTSIRSVPIDTSVHDD